MGPVRQIKQLAKRTYLCCRLSQTSRLIAMDSELASSVLVGMTAGEDKGGQ